MEVKAIDITEVGPREGFQFEGIGNPDKISTEDKIRLVDALSDTGVGRIQVTSFVHPRQVPQMADAEAVSAGFHPRPHVTYMALYLNDVGLRRAIATGRYTIEGSITLTASETFGLRNQHRTLEQDVDMQRRMLTLYKEKGVSVRRASIMAAFGCNYEGDVPITRVVDLVKRLHELAAAGGEALEVLSLADTMGWADPEHIKATVAAVRSLCPDLQISLHLHDTRGLGMANVYAGLEVGVSKFDASVGGLGGCPFAGVAAGNVATEDVVFMCERLGIETGIDLRQMVACARLAEEIVGHPLPSRLAKVA